MSGDESDSSLNEGGAPLANYEVLSAGQGAKGEALYTVKRAGAGDDAPTFVWRATKWSGKSVQQLRVEVERLKSLESPHLKIPKRPRFHEASGTLYTVTAHTIHPTLSQLRQRCHDGGFSFRENFIWRVLHQVTAVCDRLRSIRSLHWHKRFDSTRIFINPEGEVIVDPFVPRSANSQKECQNDICKFGKALYEMCALTEYTEDSIVSFECSDELKKMVNDLLHCDTSKCKISCEVILYHPTVLSHLDGSKEMFTEPLKLEVSAPTNDSAFESDESNRSKLSIPAIKSFVSNSSIRTIHSKSRRSMSEPDLSPNLLALDLNLPGYVPRKISDDVDKWRSRLDLCKEPQEVSEDALNKVWFDRLKTLRERERAVEVKEREMKKQKLFDEIRSKITYEDQSTPLHANVSKSIKSNTPGITLQTVMNEKVLPQVEKINTEPYFECKDIESIKPKPRTRRCSNSKGRCRKKISMNYEDMDSSLSADPGDGSIIFTSSKLSAELLPRPSSICSMARKKVHFTSRNNPFAEYDDVSSNVFTFFDNENNNQSYEVPIKLPQKPENIADRITKFMYLDLEALTNKKREKMEEIRQLQSNLSNIRQKTESNLDSTVQGFTTKRKTRRTKYFSPGLDSQSNIYSESSGASVSSYQPMKKVRDNRKSMPFLSISNKPNSPKKVFPNELSVCSSNVRVTRSKGMFGSTTANTPKFSLPVKKEDSLLDYSKKGKSNKENSPSPKLKRDSKRKSILGFKTPFRFHF